MKINELRGKSAADLNEHVLDLRREQFSLRMQKAQGAEAKTHEFKRVRREIARTHTVLAEQSKQGGSK